MQVKYDKNVPLPVGKRLEELEEDEAPGVRPFRELVGCLMWWSTPTRPDISNAVRAPTRYCAAPTPVQRRAALGCFVHLRRTSRFANTFEGGTVGGLNVQVFADADYAGMAADSRSETGELVMCVSRTGMAADSRSETGDLVMCVSRTQKCADTWPSQT